MESVNGQIQREIRGSSIKILANRMNLRPIQMVGQSNHGNHGNDGIEAYCLSKASSDSSESSETDMASEPASHTLACVQLMTPKVLVVERPPWYRGAQLPPHREMTLLSHNSESKFESKTYQLSGEQLDDLIDQKLIDKESWIWIGEYGIATYLGQSIQCLTDS
jgi:hypothetical protein